MLNNRGKLASDIDRTLENCLNCPMQHDWTLSSDNCGCATSDIGHCIGQFGNVRCLIKNHRIYNLHNPVLPANPSCITRTGLLHKSVSKFWILIRCLRTRPDIPDQLSSTGDLVERYLSHIRYSPTLWYLSL